VLNIHPSPEDLFHRIVRQVLITGKRQPALTAKAKDPFGTGKIYTASVTGMRIEEIQQGG
jgi:hypothetical protein